MNDFLKNIKLLFSLIVFGLSFGWANSSSIENAPIINDVSLKIDTLKLNNRTFETDFQKKYNNEQYNYTTETPSKKLSIWEKLRKFLAELFDFSLSKDGKNGLSLFFKILIYGIVVGAFLLIIKSIINKEGNWIFAKKSKKINYYNTLNENIHELNFNELIDKAKGENNYRLAIRYYYLWTLKKLTENQMIKWDIEKTNTDYLYEIKNTAIKTDFKKLSYLFEYSWYGEFQLSEIDFIKAENIFLNAKTN